jgi:hypothetical protein
MDVSDEQPKLVKIGITQLLKFSDTFAGIEVHLHLGGKYVKLNYSQDQFSDILRKLQQKDIHEVYIKQDDCKVMIEHAQAALSAKSFFNPNTVVEKKVENTENSVKIVKEVIKQMGVTPETVTLLKTANDRTMSVMSESPSLYAFVQRFKKNCSEEFLKSMLTTFVCSMMIDKFPWKSDQVKEKAAMASLLCDMMLEPEDFDHIKKWEESGHTYNLPERIRRHPMDTANKLRPKRLIASETITIIEQHHELPNGKGFPLGPDAPKFNQLAAIFIIAQMFVEFLFKENFDFSKRFDIITKLKLRYDARSFDKAIDALGTVLK